MGPGTASIVGLSSGDAGFLSPKECEREVDRGVCALGAGKRKEGGGGVGLVTQKFFSRKGLPSVSEETLIPDSHWASLHGAMTAVVVS